ncbi:FAD:protein FMN transferase [Candidatus Peribacteria bacterium]|nr:FAD:protein FMN transferase [Candidatus Peribacteria bacterium]
MTHSPKSFGYESMGTHWTISIWDEIDSGVFADLKKSILDQSKAFDETYSRFIKSSLIWSLSEKRGIVTVPIDLVIMLGLYEQFFDCTNGKVNPLVGFALGDLGYDAEYSLQPKQNVRPVPDFHDALRIIDDTHIELRESILIDLGALGKGYFVDTISSFLRGKRVKRFLVDGSGDIYYQGNGEPIRAGLEDPDDETKAIGVVNMRQGSICASGINRRKWGKFHHVLDPQSLTSPQEIAAVWVLADSAVVADGLATCLFFVDPESMQKDFEFEYCIINKHRRVKRSAGFRVELF